MTMNRENQEPVALIDLGAASVETKGPGGDHFDLVDYQKIAGLTDD
jgi:hypothetical protein